MLSTPSWLKKRGLNLKMVPRFVRNEEEYVSTSWMAIIGAFLTQLTVSSIQSTYGVLFVSLDWSKDNVGEKIHFLIPAFYGIGMSIADPWCRNIKPKRYATARLLAIVALLVIVGGIALTCTSGNFTFKILGCGLIAGIATSVVNAQTELLLKCLCPTQQGIVMTFYNVGDALGKFTMPIAAYFLVIYYGHNGGALIYSAMTFHGLFGIILLFSNSAHQNGKFQDYGYIEEKRMRDTYHFSNDTLMSENGRSWKNPGQETVNLNVLESFSYQTDNLSCPNISRRINGITIMPEITEENEDEITTHFDLAEIRKSLVADSWVIDDNEDAKCEGELLFSTADMVPKRIINENSENLSEKSEELSDYEKVFGTVNKEVYSISIYTNSSIVRCFSEDLEAITEIEPSVDTNKTPNLQNKQNGNKDGKDEADLEDLFPKEDRENVLYCLLRYTLVNPLNTLIHTRQFIPALFLKTNAKIAPMVFSSLLPLLAFNAILNCTLEAAAFAVAVAGFASLCYLVLTPWFNCVSGIKKLILYSAGCILGSIGLYVLAHVDTRDELTFGSAAFGFGNGIMVTTAIHIIPMEIPSVKIQVTLEKLAACFTVLSTLIIYIILIMPDGVRWSFAVASVFQAVTGLAWLFWPLIKTLQKEQSETPSRKQP